MSPRPGMSIVDCAGDAGVAFVETAVAGDNDGGMHMDLAVVFCLFLRPPLEPSKPSYVLVFFFTTITTKDGSFCN